MGAENLLNSNSFSSRGDQAMDLLRKETNQIVQFLVPRPLRLEGTDGFGGEKVWSAVFLVGDSWTYITRREI